MLEGKERKINDMSSCILSMHRCSVYDFEINFFPMALSTTAMKLRAKFLSENRCAS